MEWVILGLLILILLVAIWGAMRAGAPAAPVDLARIEGRLEELERRLNERLGEARTALDQSIRDVGSAHVRESGSLREGLVVRLSEMEGGLVRSLTERLEQARAAQLTELASARRSQDERLDKVDEALRAFAAAQANAVAAQQERLAEVGSKLEAQNREALKTLQELLGTQLKELRESSAGSLRELREASTQSLTDLRTALDQRLGYLQEQTTKSLGEVQQKVAEQLGEMRRDNEAKLERIRETVDEKLQTTLEKRLGESFKVVSERLESVQKGLGEMQALASGVGDLKKVLTNVSTRGAMGEVQLARILEEVMHPSQYATNVATIPGSNDRVEFAIRLPGRQDDNSPVWLPIDAKFPTEDYQRLLDAYEAAEKDQITRARAGLATRLKTEAAKIRAKYVSSPHTTEFAILFVPTEGLYAEALRIPGLFEDLQRAHNVTLCGPVTVVALLNSLQMGFKTLAIEKRSGEVWTTLKAVKTEFGKFADVLDAVAKRLEGARKDIDKVGVRTRAINRNLRGFESLEELEAEKLLFGGKGAMADEGDDETEAIDE
jgi:DNA recombination protein RmuC